MDSTKLYTKFAFGQEVVINLTGLQLGGYNSLMQLARDMGIEVEQRHIPLEELAEIDEAAACGTAAAPLAEIDDIDTGVKYVVSKDGKPGPVVTALYNKLRGIQLGEEEDIHNWNTIID